MHTPPPPPPPPPSPQRAVAVFLLAGLLVLSAVGGLLAVLQHRAAVAQAVRDARTLTALQAQDVVEPVLTDAALEPGAAHDLLHEVIAERVIGERVVRVKIWDAGGRIVYADEPALIGQTFELPPAELAALGPHGIPVAEVSNLDEPEHRGEQAFGKLLQVYLGVQTVEGAPLLFETYHPYDTIAAASRRQWISSLPALVTGLVLLWVAQAPLAWTLASRLRAAHEEREQLLVAALAAHDRERQRLAADLHDGVVQGLSGASYTLSAEAARASGRGEQEHGRLLHGVAVDLRRAVRELRSLIVTITPPGLRRQPLTASVRDLVAPLEDRGVAVRVDVAPDVELALEQPTLDLLLRTVQEGVRNILRHARADRVTVALSASRDEVVLSVRDDGAGFTGSAGRGPGRGMGLELLSGLAQQDGGRLTVRSDPGRGTELELALPRTVRAAVPV